MGRFDNEAINCKKKVWFASIKYATPSSMEYFLEEMESEGYSLLPMGEKGFLFFEFVEAKSRKSRYIVDKSSLPTTMYVETMLDNGWELMGQINNCYVWRQYYEDKRPANMGDKVCINRHNKNMKLGYTIAFVIALISIAVFVAGYIYETKRSENGGHIIYLIDALIMSPVAFLFYRIANKFGKE